MYVIMYDMIRYVRNTIHSCMTGLCALCDIITYEYVYDMTLTRTNMRYVALYYDVERSDTWSVYSNAYSISLQDEYEVYLIIYMNIKTNNMKRINDLHPQTRLDLIEETRWQFGQDWVQTCITHNFAISGMCKWDETRQGARYWALVDSGAFDPVMN